MLRLFRSLALVAAAIAFIAGISLPWATWKNPQGKIRYGKFWTADGHEGDPVSVYDGWGATHGFTFTGITFETQEMPGVKQKAVTLPGSNDLVLLQGDLLQTGPTKTIAVTHVELHQDETGTFREKIDDWTVLSSPPLASSFDFALYAVPLALLTCAAAAPRWKILVSILALPMVVVGILPIFTVQPFLSLAPRLENYSIQLDATRGLGIYVTLAASFLAAIGIVLVWMEPRKAVLANTPPSAPPES